MKNFIFRVVGPFFNKVGKAKLSASFAEYVSVLFVFILHTKMTKVHTKIKKKKKKMITSDFKKTFMIDS